MNQNSVNVHPSFEDNLRLVFIQYCTQMQHLLEVFANAEKHRADRHEEILNLVRENDQNQFYEKYGRDAIREYSTVDLWYKPMLVQSLFLIAYSAFELLTREISERMEGHYLTRKKISSIGRKGKSYVGIYREY